MLICKTKRTKVFAIDRVASSGAHGEPHDRRCALTRSYNLHWYRHDTIRMAYHFFIPSGGRLSLLYELLPYPCKNHVMNIANFILVKWPVAFDMMPLFQTSTTTGRAGMLSDEYRMPAKRGLTAFVRHSSRCQPGADEIKRMVTDNVKASVGYIVTVMMR